MLLMKMAKYAGFVETEEEKISKITYSLTPKKHKVIDIVELLDCEQSLSFPHNQSNLEVQAGKRQSKTV